MTLPFKDWISLSVGIFSAGMGGYLAALWSPMVLLLLVPVAAGNFALALNNNYRA